VSVSSGSVGTPVNGVSSVITATSCPGSFPYAGSAQILLIFEVLPPVSASLSRPWIAV
jgi:hypothetical protein